MQAGVDVYMYMHDIFISLSNKDEVKTNAWLTQDTHTTFTGSGTCNTWQMTKWHWQKFPFHVLGRADPTVQSYKLGPFCFQVETPESVFSFRGLCAGHPAMTGCNVYFLMEGSPEYMHPGYSILKRSGKVRNRKQAHTDCGGLGWWLAVLLGV